MRVAVVPIVDPSSKVRRISPEQLPSRKIAELGGTGRRRARFAAQSGPQRAYSNGRFLANPNIRWRSDEWLLRVDLSRSIVVRATAGIGAWAPLTHRSGGRRASRRLSPPATAAQRSIPDPRPRSSLQADGYAPGLTGIGRTCPFSVIVNAGRIVSIGVCKGVIWWASPLSRVPGERTVQLTRADCLGRVVRGRRLV